MLEENRARKLKFFLDALRDGADAATRLRHDPLGLVRAYSHADDQEVVALIASCLAYGRVDVMRAAIQKILDVLGPSPAEFLAHANWDWLEEALDGWVYRMTSHRDVVDLIHAIATLRQLHGTLENAYLHHDGDTHLARASAFVLALRAAGRRDEVTRGFRYLLPDPGLGSTTKRLHLFFRWMVRQDDGVDLGVWSNVSPAVLIMPLDTHTARLCRYIGLTSRLADDLRTAQEVTEALRQLDPHDPLRYDFPLCHLGISRGCIHRRSDQHCPHCPIREICTLPDGLIAGSNEFDVHDVDINNPTG